MTRPLIYEDSTLPIHAYLDGELDPTNALAVEKRMATDPALAAECERVDALQRLMREHLPREAPPPGLRMRVETAVGLRRPRTQLSHAQFSWRALAASIAVTAVVASGATSMLRPPSGTDLVRDGIVDAHIRSLMASQPIDVASSDRHTVKPWFNGRIPQGAGGRSRQRRFPSGRRTDRRCRRTPGADAGLWSPQASDKPHGDTRAGPRQFGTGTAHGGRI
jgi:anti-sigma factor RsiW